MRPVGQSDRRVFATGFQKSHNLRTNVPTHEHGTYSDCCTTRQRFTVILHNTCAGVGARGHARQTQKTRLWRKGSYPSHGRQASSPISIQCCRCKCNPIGFDMPSVTPRQSGNATGDAAPGRNGPPSNLTYLPRLKTPSPGESRSPSQRCVPGRNLSSRSIVCATVFEFHQPKSDDPDRERGHRGSSFGRLREQL